MTQPNKYPDLEALAKGVQLAIKPLSPFVKIEARINSASNGELCCVEINTSLSNRDIKEIERKILTGKNAYIGISGHDIDALHLTLRVNELQDEFLL